MTLAIVGLVALLGAGVAFARSGNQSNVELNRPSLTSTLGDVTDESLESEPSTSTIGDITDNGDRPRAGTGTVSDVDDSRPGAQLGALAVVDERGECFWLADVPGEAPQTLFLVAWPAGAEITWDPFELRLGRNGPTVVESSRIVADGTIVDTVEELSADDQLRLLGLDRCQYEGVLVLDDTPNNVEVSN